MQLSITKSTMYHNLISGSSVFGYREEMDYFVDHPYWLLRWMLNSTGLWPSASERTHIIAFCLLTLNFTIIFGLLIKCIIAFPNIELVAHVLTYSSLFCTICTSHVCCYCNASKIKELWVCIERDWKELEKTNRSFIAECYATKCNLLSLLISIFSFIYVIFVITELILPALLDAIAPLNQTRSSKSPISFELEDYKKLNSFVMLIMSLFVMLVATIMILLLSEFVVFLLHACLLFSLVGNVLERGFVAVGRSDASDDNKILQERIVESVRYHVAAIRFTKLINESYEVLCFFLMIEFIITLSTSSLYLFYTIQSHDLTAMILTLLSLLSLLAIAFVITHAGQLVVDHSLEVYNKVCSMPSYLASIKIQKLLVIILLRSKISSFISLGKIAILAHGLFTTMLYNGISFATVFMSV